jgi:phage-related protein
MADGRVVIDVKLNSDTAKKDAKLLENDLNKNLDNVEADVDLNTEESKREIVRLKKELADLMNEAKRTKPKININTSLDTIKTKQDADLLKLELEKRIKNVKARVELESDETYREIRKLKLEFSSMQREMQLTNMKAMLPFQKNLMQSKKNMFDLAQQMGNFTGTNKQFMGQVQQLGAEHKKATDAMINSNKMLGMSMIKQAGMMMNMTTQATRIADGYNKMKNPLLMVNNLGLRSANALNQLANRGDASVLALKRLGPNASMKALRDEQMKITQGQMRFNMVALASLAVGAMVFGGLHKHAMEFHKGYREAFGGMAKNVKDAFHPLRQVFVDLMIPVFNFISAISKMAIEFNKAHPTIAKILQAILLLVPALFIILSPLAIGIGLWAGMLSALNSVWMLIGPLITGLAAMSATVWIVAGAIVGLVAVFVILYNKSEWFRTQVQTVWSNVVSAAKIAWEFIMNSILLPVWNAIVDLGKKIFGQLKQFWEENGNNIKAFAIAIWEAIKTYVIYYITAIVVTAKALFEVIRGVVQSVWENIKGIIQSAIQIVLSIIGIFVATFTGDWQGAWENAKNLFSALWDFVKNSATIGINAFLGIIRGIGNALGGVFKKIGDKFYKAGKDFIQRMLDGIKSLAGSIGSAISNILGNFNPFSIEPLEPSEPHPTPTPSGGGPVDGGSISRGIDSALHNIPTYTANKAIGARMQRATASNIINNNNSSIINSNNDELRVLLEQIRDRIGNDIFLDGNKVGSTIDRNLGSRERMSERRLAF